MFFLKTGLVFSPIYISPRSLGGLESYTICQLYGWGSTYDLLPRRDSVIVYDSQNCDPRFPSLYCSTFITNQTTCSANLGSPLVCSSDGNSIDGLLINENSCTSYNNRYLLNYISIEKYKDWVNCVIAGTESCDALIDTPTTTTGETSTVTTSENPGDTSTLSGMSVKMSITLVVSALLSAIFM